MNSFVVDTHALAWYFTNDSRLSKKVEDIIEQAEKGKKLDISPNHCACRAFTYH
jgi:PIN domain nuclease of toxin-antitoxin system